MTTHQAVLDREYLRLRKEIVDVARILDEVDRADDPPQPDPRLGQVREAVDILDCESGDRVRQIQEVFSAGEHSLCR